MLYCPYGIRRVMGGIRHIISFDKFKSDFWIVADYFWQLANNPDYIPTKKTIKHVQALLQLMAALTNDMNYERVYNKFIKQSQDNGGDDTMAGFLGSAIEKGRQEGLEKGRQEGLQEGRNEGLLEGQKKFADSFIQTSEEEGKTTVEIIADLQKYFKLTESQAKEYYENYRVTESV